MTLYSRQCLQKKINNSNYKFGPVSVLLSGVHFRIYTSLKGFEFGVGAAIIL